MNIQEILSRPNGSEYTTQEMLYCVEDYINRKKGVQVRIDILKGFTPDTLSNLNPFGRVHLQAEIERLSHAFDVVKAEYHKK